MINKLLVFTGPSGVGKATIEKRLFKNKDLKLSFSISATTRSPRKGEVHGEHYYFLTHKEFDEKVKNNEFIEWNEHFSNKYGTLKSEIKRIANKNHIPFLEVEVNGAVNVIKSYGKENTISIFITPPSVEDLRKRIKNRGSETKEQIKERLARFEEEMSYSQDFDYRVVNDDLSSAVKKVKNIIVKELF